MSQKIDGETSTHLYWAPRVTNKSIKTKHTGQIQESLITRGSKSLWSVRLHMWLSVKWSHSWTAKLWYLYLFQSQCRLWTFTASVHHVSKQYYETKVWKHSAHRFVSGHWDRQNSNIFGKNNIKYRDLGNMTLPMEALKSWFDCQDVGRCLNQLSLATVAMSPARGDWTACCRWVKVIICWCGHSSGGENKQILAQRSGICCHITDISL